MQLSDIVYSTSQGENGIMNYSRDTHTQLSTKNPTAEYRSSLNQASDHIINKLFIVLIVLKCILLVSGFFIVKK